MGAFLVTAFGIAAVGVAAILGLWLRGSRLDVADPSVDAGWKGRLAERARITSAALVGGIVAGWLMAGFGGRLLMRLVAVTSDDSAQGRLTEADEVVGRVTGDGTAFLVIFGGLFVGIVGALAFSTFRRFLPSQSWLAGLIVAGVIGGLLARPVDLLNPDSIDFEILGPRWFAAGLGVALIGGLGIVGGELIDTLTRRWPTPALTPTGMAGLLPLLVLGGIGPGLLIVVPVLILLVVGHPGRFVVRSPATLSVISGLMMVAGVVGWLWIAGTAVQIAV